MRSSRLLGNGPEFGRVMRVSPRHPIAAAGLLAATVTIAAVAVAFVARAGPAGAAAAVERYDRPADGIFHFTGHGFGHGSGLNQWGAQGGALAGATLEQILDAYYPGTQVAVAPNRALRVLIDTNDGRQVTVRSAPGLSLADLATGQEYALSEQPPAWRVLPTTNGLVVQQQLGTGWSEWQSPSGQRIFGGPLRITAAEPLWLLFPDGSARQYHGSLQAVANGSNSLFAVSVVPLESYLYDVVSREMTLSFEMAALEAQAVAARSYALNRIAAEATEAYDTCSDSWKCATYGGIRYQAPDGALTEYEHPRATAAVDATAGEIRTYQGEPIFAEFSASNGGWTRAWRNWPPKPYLVANPDPWDAISPNHTWLADVTAAQIEGAYPAVGRLLAIGVAERDGAGEWGGRVLILTLEGTDGAGNATAVNVAGDDFMWVAPPTESSGLRSGWWIIVPTTSAPAISAPDIVTARTGMGMQVDIRVAGTPTPSITLEGTVPAGLGFLDAGDGTARISGSPSTGTGGTYTFQIVASNLAGTVGQPLTLQILEAPTISADFSSPLQVGRPAVARISVYGFPAPSVSVEGRLPLGLKFAQGSSGYGLITGTPGPGAGGIYSVVFIATNSVDSARLPASISVQEVPNPGWASSRDITAGTAFTLALVASGFPTPSLSLSGKLPAGAEVSDGAHGRIALTGIAAAGSGGAYPLTITAFNGVGPGISRVLVLVVDEAPAVITGQLVFRAEQDGSFPVQTAGFPRPALGLLDGLPAGLAFFDLGDGRGKIAGAPALGTGGAYTARLEVSNGVGPKVIAGIQIVVQEAPRIEGRAALHLAVGQNASFDFHVSGFPAPSVSPQDPLPRGLTLISGTEGGVTIRGKPARASGGSHLLRLTASNLVGATTRQLHLVIREAPFITRQPRSVVACVGDTVRLNADAAGFPTPREYWQKSQDDGATWQTMKSARGRVLVRRVLASDRVRLFRVIFRNAIGLRASRPVRIHICRMATPDAP